MTNPEPMMDGRRLELALRRLSETFTYHCDVEVLIVGGAAAMLTGLLGPARTTRDCDVMVVEPETAALPLLNAAETIAAELGLDSNWLNDHVSMRRDALPAGWKDRRIRVDVRGQLHVWSLSRPDLVAMKLLAGRPQDLEDLEQFRLRDDDVPFLERYLDELHERGTLATEIDAARIRLSSLPRHRHE